MRQLLASFMLIVCAPLLAQEGCELFNIQELSDAYLNFQVDTIILQPDGSFEVQLSNGTTFTQVQGCTDTSYLEYDASANTDDGSCTTPVVNGCTDPTYTEYNAAANTDDGSCTTPVVEGCTDPAYTEYDASANTDDGSCTTPVVNGCTDPTYTEYNVAANTDDGSCTTPVVEGCTDPAYTEYDASANTDDGSCITPVVEGCTDPADVNYNAAANTDDGSCASYPCSSIEFYGYTYSVVEIGDQCWFAENLRTTLYANGDAIPAGLTQGEWASTTAGALAVYGQSALAAYGRLYNWYAVDDARGLCPAGWHVPTDGEWTVLKAYITSQGFSGTEGAALKSTSGWQTTYSNGNGTDNFGFSALPGGYREDDVFGGFSDAGINGDWWTSTPYGSNAFSRSLFSFSPLIFRYFGAHNPRKGYSVRCLRDAE